MPQLDLLPWLNSATLMNFWYDEKMKTTLKMKTNSSAILTIYRIKVTKKERRPQKWKWPQIWRRMKMHYKMKTSSKIAPPPHNNFAPPPSPIMILPDFFWRPLTSTATPQIMLKWKCYQVSKPEIEFQMIDIMYAALHMGAHT